MCHTNLLRGTFIHDVWHAQYIERRFDGHEDRILTETSLSDFFPHISLRHDGDFTWILPLMVVWPLTKLTNSNKSHNGPPSMIRVFVAGTDCNLGYSLPQYFAMKSRSVFASLQRYQTSKQIWLRWQMWTYSKWPRQCHEFFQWEGAIIFTTIEWGRWQTIGKVCVISSWRMRVNRNDHDPLRDLDHSKSVSFFAHYYDEDVLASHDDDHDWLLAVGGGGLNF